MYPGDLVSHPTDGTFRIEAVNPTAPLYPEGRVKRVDGPWYAAHTLTLLVATWPNGERVEIGQHTTRGVITEINHERRMAALNGGKLLWPVNLLARQ